MLHESNTSTSIATKMQGLLQMVVATMSFIPQILSLMREGNGSANWISWEQDRFIQNQDNLSLPCSMLHRSNTSASIAFTYDSDDKVPCSAGPVMNDMRQWINKLD